MARAKPGPGSASHGADSRVAPLSRAVRARREDLGLRQSELADLAGCSERFVHTVEHGKASLRLDKLLDVLEVLGLDLLAAPGRGRTGVVPDDAAGPGEGA